MVRPWPLVAVVFAATVLGPAWADTGFNGTAYVASAADLLKAGNNASVADIVLLGNITLDRQTWPNGSYINLVGRLLTIRSNGALSFNRTTRVLSGVETLATLDCGGLWPVFAVGAGANLTLSSMRMIGLASRYAPGVAQYPWPHVLQTTDWPSMWVLTGGSLRMDGLVQEVLRTDCSSAALQSMVVQFSVIYGVVNIGVYAPNAVYTLGGDVALEVQMGNGSNVPITGAYAYIFPDAVFSVCELDPYAPVGNLWPPPPPPPPPPGTGSGGGMPAYAWALIGVTAGVTGIAAGAAILVWLHRRRRRRRLGSVPRSAARLPGAPGGLTGADRCVWRWPSRCVPCCCRDRDVLECNDDDVQTKNTKPVQRPTPLESEWSEDACGDRGPAGPAGERSSVADLESMLPEAEASPRGNATQASAQPELWARTPVASATSSRGVIAAAALGGSGGGVPVLPSDSASGASVLVRPGSLASGLGSPTLRPPAPSPALSALPLVATRMRVKFGVIDDLDLGECVGMGDYGRVHRGRWRGVPVAIKIVRGSLGGSGEEAKAMWEGLLSASLHHPNVVTCYKIALVATGGMPSVSISSGGGPEPAAIGTSMEAAAAAAQEASTANLAACSAFAGMVKDLAPAAAATAADTRSRPNLEVHTSSAGTGGIQEPTALGPEARSLSLSAMLSSDRRGAGTDGGSRPGELLATAAQFAALERRLRGSSSVRLPADAEDSASSDDRSGAGSTFRPSPFATPLTADAAGAVAEAVDGGVGAVAEMAPSGMTRVSPPPSDTSPSPATTPARGPTIPSPVGGDGVTFLAYETWMVLEYCDRGSLDAVLRRRRFVSPRTGAPLLRPVLLVLRDVARGMAYLHALNIVHGDLKAANVLLKSAEGLASAYVAKIADFGLSQMLDPGQTWAATMTLGSLGYMPPEAMRTGQLTKATDIYSFGVLAWELATGDTAFAGLDAAQVYYMVQAQGYSLPDPALPRATRRRGSRSGQDVRASGGHGDDAKQSPSSSDVDADDHCTPEPLAALIRECLARDVTARPDFDECAARIEAMIPLLLLGGSGAGGMQGAGGPAVASPTAADA